MNEAQLEELRYPVGHFAAPEEITSAHVAAWIDEIERLPAELRAAVEPLSAAQLDTRYRPGGWSVRQVVHHVADSHLNSILRFKWTLTEERPTIKPYHEDRWAELGDYAAGVETSLFLLEALHARWVELLRTLGPDELRREFLHPESGVVRLDANVGIYAWHGRHHLAHVTRLAAREGWSRAT
jgi:hypothetical protein